MNLLVFSEKHFLFILLIFNLLKLILWPNILFILGKVPCVLEKNMYSTLLKGSLLLSLVSLYCCSRFYWGFWHKCLWFSFLLMLLSTFICRKIPALQNLENVSLLFSVTICKEFVLIIISYLKEFGYGLFLVRSFLNYKFNL